jgi:DNA-binding CsgD family transcriptional regulator
MIQSRSTQTPLRSLTVRQQEVARLIVDRYSQKEIAGELNISETTVQRHVTAIKRRLHVNSLREIAALLREQDPDGGWEKPTVGKNDIAPSQPFWPTRHTDEPFVLKGRGSGAMNFLPFMPDPDEPRIVPRLLDGKHRVPLRFATITGMVLIGIVAIILTVAAIQSISELVRGSFSDRVLEKAHETRRDGRGRHE